MMGYEAANCKGSWALGSACGRCARCAEEAVDTLPHHMARVKEMEKKLMAVAMVIPRPPSRDLGYDLSNHVKISLFNEARVLMHGPLDKE